MLELERNKVIWQLSEDQIKKLLQTNSQLKTN